MRTKRELGIFLSKLKVFENPKWRLEQYPTESDIAAEIIWHGHIVGDFEDKTVADLGCGTGILGIAALLAGAKKVFFVDVDSSAIDIAKKNLEWVNEEYEIEGESEFIQSEITALEGIKADVVIQNPPFGVKVDHADRKFLVKAFQIAPIIYSLHKIESKGFIANLSKDGGFRIDQYFEFEFPLKQTMDYHKSRIKKIKVGCWKLIKEE